MAGGVATGNGRRRGVKIGLALLALGGLGGAVAMVVANDAGKVFAALASQGWGLAAVVASHAVPLVVSAAAWLLLSKPGWPAGRFPVYLWARVLREGVNDLLPTAQLGGPAAGARALVLHGAPVTPMAGAVVVDLTTEVASQLVFAMLGIVVLALIGDAPSLVRYGLIGLAVMGPVLAAFVAAQRFGLMHLVDRVIAVVAGLGGSGGRESSVALHDAVWAIYRRRARLAAAVGMHLGSWALGAGEIWLALHFLGHPLPFAAAFVIESLSQAIRGAAFVVPSALGVLEGSYVLLGAAFGLDPQTSLALSLTRRVREISFGAPSVIAWQLVEGQRLIGAARRPRPAEAAGE